MGNLKLIELVGFCGIGIFLFVLTVRGLFNIKQKRQDKEEKEEDIKGNKIIQITLRPKNKKGCIGLVTIDNDITYNFFSYFFREYNKISNNIQEINTIKKFNKKEIYTILVYLLYVKIDLKKSSVKKLLRNSTITIKREIKR